MEESELKELKSLRKRSKIISRVGTALVLASAFLSGRGCYRGLTSESANPYKDATKVQQYFDVDQLRDEVRKIRTQIEPYSDGFPGSLDRIKDPDKYSRAELPEISDIRKETISDVEKMLASVKNTEARVKNRFEALGETEAVKNYNSFLIRRSFRGLGEFVGFGALALLLGWGAIKLYDKKELRLCHLENKHYEDKRKEEIAFL